jgi:hypothetical protein
VDAVARLERTPLDRDAIVAQGARFGDAAFSGAIHDLLLGLAVEG